MGRPSPSTAWSSWFGGGIAGLAAAWQLRDRDVLLFEAEERTGGRIRSEARGRYWLNFGAHVFGGAGSATGTLIDEARVEAATVPGVLTAVSLNGSLLASGRVESYPFRLPLAPADRLALMRVGLRLRVAVARYGRIVRPRPGESEAERRARTLGFLGDRSFADFVGPVPPEVDALFRPTIQRSSAEPEDVAAGYGVGYFHLVWNRTEGLSRNILGGPSTLTDAIASALGRRVRRRAGSRSGGRRRRRPCPLPPRRAQLHGDRTLRRRCNVGVCGRKILHELLARRDGSGARSDHLRPVRGCSDPDRRDFADAVGRHLCDRGTEAVVQHAPQHR